VPPPGEYVVRNPGEAGFEDLLPATTIIDPDSQTVSRLVVPLMRVTLQLRAGFLGAKRS
jgi:hypothetical protein